jgi:hypothetical protein
MTILGKKFTVIPRVYVFMYFFGPDKSQRKPQIREKTILSKNNINCRNYSA